MLKVFLCMAFFILNSLTISNAYSEISSFFVPYGFQAPLLEKGQYTLNFNPHYYRQELGEKYSSGFNESISKQYGLSLKGIYALTDKLVFQSNVILYPGQTHSTYSSVWNTPYNGLILGQKMREHSNFKVSPGMGISFRPQANIQLYGDFLFSKETGFSEYLEYEGYKRIIDIEVKDIYFALGFTILGRLSGDKRTEGSNSRIFNFLRPYGFRAPLIDQGQYAVNFNSLYAKTELSEDYIWDPDPSESAWEKYYFSLNGLYAMTERLILQGALDVYPAQTRETKEIRYPSVSWDYNELHSDFMVVPCFTASLRPKANMEFYGVFRFRRENLCKVRPPDLFDSQVRNDICHLELGYTILGKRSPRASAPIPGSEFSNFFTSYGFRTPMLKGGQYALNVNSCYERTESKEHYPENMHRHNDRSVDKTYYFSLNGVYAVLDELIIECNLDVFPGLTNVTSWYRLDSDIIGASWELEDKQHSHFTVSPHFEVCFRPRINLELYGSFSLNKENMYRENRLGGHTYSLSMEDIYFDFGLTILGGL